MENSSSFTDIILNLYASLGTYDERKVDSTVVDGLRVSTAYSTDCGYETAICDSRGIYPVERYPDLNSAVVGHSRWVAKAPGLEEITELGWLDLCGPEEVKLVRGEKIN